MLIAIFRSNKLLISSCMTVQLNYERMSSDLGMLMPEECQIPAHVNQVWELRCFRSTFIQSPLKSCKQRLSFITALAAQNRALSVLETSPWCWSLFHWESELDTGPSGPCCGLCQAGSSQSPLPRADPAAAGWPRAGSPCTEPSLSKKRNSAAGYCRDSRDTKAAGKWPDKFCFAGLVTSSR